MKAVNEVTTPAPGVKRTECAWGYLLEGRREALVSSGLAAGDWFPPAGARDARGRIIRTRHSKSGGRKITCCQDGARYVISIHYTEEESERAEAERRAARMAEAARTMERLQLAPPVDPESLTPGERHHIRLLRTLDAFHREVVLTFALQYLARCAADGLLSVAQRRLQLVVDNNDRPT